MNENTKKRAGVAFLASALSLAVISAILRALNIFFFFDSNLGYYKSGAALPLISNILLGVGAVFFIAFAFIYFKNDDPKYSSPCATQVSVSVISAVTALALAAGDIINAVKDMLNADKDGRLGILTAVLSLMCALYFICALVDIKPIFKALAGIFTIARLTFMLGASYFDQNVQMNAPDKIMFGLACVFSMLFVASELKVFVGTAKMPVYLISAALSTVFSATASIPSIIAVHTNRLPESNGLYMEYYLLLGIALYAGARLTLSMLNIIKDKKAETVGDADTSEADCEE